MRCFVRGLKAGGRACGYRESVNLSPSFTTARNMHTSAPTRAEGSLRGFGIVFFFFFFYPGWGPRKEGRWGDSKPFLLSVGGGAEA